MANSKLFFFTIFVIIQLSWCALSPMYSKDQGKKKFFDVGKVLELSCSVTGADEKASDITWNKEENDNLDANQITVKDKVSTLKIAKTESKDDGKYYCKYQNEQNHFDVIAKLAVRIKPNTDVAVVEGEALTLKCVGVGTHLIINWVFDSNITEHVSFKDSDGLANSTLEIQKVDKSYRGNFTCEGRHDERFLELDTVVSSTAYVRVKDKYAALWPFILICIEVFILCAIILIYEKHRTHVEVEDSETEPDLKNGKN